MHADKHQRFYKLGLFFWMEVAEYVQSTQNRKLMIFLQYIYIYIYIYILTKECHSCFCVLYDAKHKGMRAHFQKKGKKVQNI